MTSASRPAGRFRQGAPDVPGSTDPPPRSSLLVRALAWGALATGTLLLGLWSFDWTWFVLTATTATAASWNLVAWFRSPRVGSSGGPRPADGRPPAR